MSDREKRLLYLLGPAVLVVLFIRFVVLSDSSPSTKPILAIRSASQTEKQLAKLRQVAATVPAKEALLTQVDAELGLREKGVLVADTAPQAQARLLEIAKKVAKAEGIELRGGDLGQVKNYGADYGEATVAISFECHIEQFVNFMAGLSHEPELLAPSDLRINTANVKEKTIGIRMILGGMVPKKMVPERKGFSLY